MKALGGKMGHLDGALEDSLAGKITRRPNKEKIRSKATVNLVVLG